MGKVVENIEEVVLAVEHQDEAVALFEELFGLEFRDSWMMPNYDIKVKSARVGDTQFQIVASTSPDAVIAKYIQDRGEGIHHIAFRVGNLDETILRLKAKGIKLVPEEPVRREETSSRYIFVHPMSIHGVLIELIERG